MGDVLTPTILTARERYGTSLRAKKQTRYDYIYPRDGNRENTEKDDSRRYDPNHSLAGEDSCLLFDARFSVILAVTHKPGERGRKQ